MKKLLKVVLVAGCMLLIGGFAKAQTKIGYINFNQLIDQMPQMKTVQASAQAYQKQFVDVLQGMQTELTTKGQAYDAGRATMTDAIRAQKETELQDLNKRMQDYNTTAQQKVQEKYNELAKPVVDQAKAAINAVAKEKGYTYVLDTTQGEPIVAPPTDDLMASVKLKLGLK
jgi:outer membrane protein